MPLTLVETKGSQYMRRTEHLGARALATIGLVATLSYLIWRVGFTLHDTDLRLSLPTLAVEVVGFLGALALTWALWPVPTRRQAGDSVGVTSPVDAVVRVGGQHPVHEVRATLLALRSVQHINDVVLVDLSASPAVAALATEFQVVHAPTDAADRNGLRVMMAAVRTPKFLLIDAGDIPTGDIVERLDADFDDPRVAVVQGHGVSLAEQSAEHGPNGRHELLFERNALNPALGRRGNAVWLGTGSLVRTDALRDVRFDTSSALEAHWLAGVALLAAGWRVTAPADSPVVAHRPVQSEQSVAEDRQQRARAARRMVFGASGVLRLGSFGFGQRVAVAAWAVRPLSGFRRVVFLALLASAILSGSAPFHATATVMVCGWLPAFAYTSLGLALLSGWTLRPGDRARWSLHSMGAACRSLGSGRERPASRAPIIALPSPQYGAGLVIAVVGLSVVLVLRGVSDRLTHTLGELPQAQLMALLIVTLWALALSLDLLRVLARRSQLRRTARIASSLPATLGERAVSIVDLTALGAGLLSQTGVEVNERLLLDSAIPTRSGVTTMRVRCMVRNVSRRADGDFRIGVEFGDTNDATANALAEFCTIEPVWERLGMLPAGVPIGEAQLTFVDEPDSQPATGRMALRVVSLFALVGVVASSVPATVDASASINHRLSGIVLAAAVEPEPAIYTTTSTPDTIVVSTSVLTTVGDTVVNETVVDTVVNETVVDTVVAKTVVDTTEVSIGESAPVPGAVVVAVCSLEAGVDGAWGTADDHYGSPVSTMTEPDGTYQLSLVGEACWATVAPPELLADPDGEVVLAAIDVSGASTTDQRVVVQRAESDAVVPTTDALGQPTSSKFSSLVLIDATGRTVGLVKADGVRGLQFVTEKDSSLPAPAASQIATVTTSQRSALSVFVLAVAALLALSIVLGLAHPRSPRVKRLQDA